MTNEISDDAVVDKLIAVRDALTSWLLDNCPDDESWEEFEPDIDAVQAALSELIGQLIARQAGGRNEVESR